ncbi:MAG: alpha/beta hydrolase [Leptolyngbya sp. SIO1D8]|nr:alpha/beta hydrolase [Leptolyngbya sp. SIO1D8]
MQMMTVGDSVQLAFETFGDSQQPLILLIAGAGAPAAFWVEAFCQDLAAHGYFVVCYSNRDTDLSTHFETPYPIETLPS